MVDNGFKTKQVNTLTFGERFREARSSSGLSLEQLGDKTKIPLKYLKYLEEENYDNLPAEIYIKGFLRSCSDYLKINPDLLIELYTKELRIRNNLKKSIFSFSGEKNTKTPFPEKAKKILSSKFNRPAFTITPKFILMATTLSAFLLVVFYFWYQIHSFIKGPELSVVEPSRDMVIKEGKITLKGQADPQSIIKINGIIISLSPEGVFNQTLDLRQGSNLIEIVATNRQGKSSEVTRRIVVE